jgi:phenylalanyl-tRNA synthetase beta chain
MLPTERELLSAVFAADGDDAAIAVSVFSAVCEELALVGLKLRAPGAGHSLAGLHPTRSARILSAASGAVVGTIGEIDPEVAEGFGVAERRVGWLELELGLLFDPEIVERRSGRATPVSRYPSSDVDLALVVDDATAVDEVADVLARAGGELLESVSLFDVYRGPGVAEGRRSLAFHLRFCARDRTLTDREIGELRARCVEAAERELGAALR